MFHLGKSPVCYLAIFIFLKIFITLSAPSRFSSEKYFFLGNFRATFVFQEYEEPVYSYSTLSR